MEQGCKTAKQKMFSIHGLKRKRNKLLILLDSLLESLSGLYLVEIVTANIFKSIRWVLPSTKGMAFVLIVCKILHRWALKKRSAHPQVIPDILGWLFVVYPLCSVSCFSLLPEVLVTSP